MFFTKRLSIVLPCSRTSQICRSLRSWRIWELRFLCETRALRGCRLNGICQKNQNNWCINRHLRPWSDPNHNRTSSGRSSEHPFGHFCESPLNKSWYNQQIEQRPLVEATGARYLALHSHHRFEEGIQEAFLTAERDQIPVVIGTPFDLHDNCAAPPKNDYPLFKTYQESVSLPSASKNDVLALVSAMIGAERPVIMAGIGASEPATVHQLAVLAEKCDAFLVTTLPARGLFHKDPFYLGVAGGFASQVTRRFLADADLIVTFGVRFRATTQTNKNSGPMRL